jgi:glycosyltransferase involved in cell wall biosynthesis
MRICFVSYEYPPDTGFGGIATYVQQIATLFSDTKIHVEVVCGTSSAGSTVTENEFLRITRIHCANREKFITLSPGAVLDIHREHKLDMIEVPEYGAEGLFMKEQLPGIPLIIKLHTPRFLTKQLNDHYYNQTFLRKLKSIAGIAYSREKDLEYQAILKADHIISPSVSLKKIIAEKWNIPIEKIIHAPYPYRPADALLNIKPGSDTQNVLYIGRLETRKGVYNLSKAIPRVIQTFPNAKFIFLGRDSQGPLRQRSMKEVMKKQLGAAIDQTAFIDHVSLDSIPHYLSDAAICVFPSLWENFPNVCLEAMAAGRAIVASREGGMNDMLVDISGSVLVDPHSIDSISTGIIEMLQNDQRRHLTGIENRKKLVSYYGNTLHDELIELYRSFIITPTALSL